MKRWIVLKSATWPMDYEVEAVREALQKAEGEALVLASREDHNRCFASDGGWKGWPAALANRHHGFVLVDPADQLHQVGRGTMETLLVAQMLGKPVRWLDAEGRLWPGHVTALDDWTGYFVREG